jgi:hypothetical protein
MPWPPPAVPKQCRQHGACFGRWTIRRSGIPWASTARHARRPSDEVAGHPDPRPSAGPQMLHLSSVDQYAPADVLIIDGALAARITQTAVGSFADLRSV